MVSNWQRGESATRRRRRRAWGKEHADESVGFVRMLTRCCGFLLEPNIASSSWSSTTPIHLIPQSSRNDRLKHLGFFFFEIMMSLIHSAWLSLADLNATVILRSLEGSRMTRKLWWISSSQVTLLVFLKNFCLFFHLLLKSLHSLHRSADRHDYMRTLKFQSWALLIAVPLIWIHLIVSVSSLSFTIVVFTLYLTGNISPPITLEGHQMIYQSPVDLNCTLKSFLWLSPLRCSFHQFISNYDPVHVIILLRPPHSTPSFLFFSLSKPKLSDWAVVLLLV